MFKRGDLVRLKRGLPYQRGVLVANAPVMMVSHTDPMGVVVRWFDTSQHPLTNVYPEDMLETV
jgi:uncharacterized protein YodC (DUF2158 family)